MKECIRAGHPCNFKQVSGNSAECMILGNHYLCLDEEEYMSDVLEQQVKMKKRGMKELRMVEKHIKELNDYLENCSIADVLDRIGDSVRELRKARIIMIERYEIDIEDLMKGQE